MEAEPFGEDTKISDTDDDYEPAWSPDGQQIAFTREPYTEYDSEIFVMNKDGSGVKRLTNNASDDSSPTWQPIVP